MILEPRELELPGPVMDKQKRFGVALAVYVVLAILIWTTMSDAPVPVGSGHISVRGLTLAILAFFAVRTVLHWKAEQIRDAQDVNAADLEDGRR